jgi:hypothetical protein
MKLSEACQEKLLDAVVRETEGMHIVHHALSGRETRYIIKLLQDIQTIVYNDLIDLLIVEIFRR